MKSGLPTIPALAFFTRYLREDARSWITALVRAGVLVLCLLSLWMFTNDDFRRPEPAPGRSLLLVFSMVALTAVHLFGVSHFASVITEEKEDQTLGLLVITGLHPVAILAGKAGARLLGGGLVLLLSLPLSLLCYALGGVSGPQIVATYVVLGAMMLVLSAAGLLMSILTRRTKVAVSLVVLLLVLLHLGGPILNFIRWICVENDWYGRDSLRMAALNGLANAWVEANPYRRLSLVLGTLYEDGWIPSGLLPMTVPALVFYALSIPAFLRLTGNLREAEGGGRKRRSATATAAARAPLTWPIFWKDHRWRAARPWMAWLYPLFLASASLIMLWVQLDLANAKDGDWFTNEWACVVTGTSMMYFSALFFVFRGGNVWSLTFATEVRDETFAALVTLPGGLGQAVKEKCAAVLRGLLPDALTFCVGALLCLGEVLRQWFRPWNWDFEPLFLLGCVVFGGACAVVLFWMLCLRLSLALKRGAAMAALALMGAGALLFLLIMLGLRPDSAAAAGVLFFLAGILCLVIARIQFQSAIGRLGEAAGD